MTLKCPDCGAQGAVVWDADGSALPAVQRKVIEITGEFHAEEGRTAISDPVIVCNVCDVIQDV